VGDIIRSIGELKGDARCCYLKVESVALALQILDGQEIEPGHAVSITRATFTKKMGGKRKAKPVTPATIELFPTVLAFYTMPKSTGCSPLQLQLWYGSAAAG
jgi:hypothetical protein